MAQARDAEQGPDSPPRLRRSRHERLVAGVCGGIADSTGLDPSLVRAVAALACFVGGAGFVGYAAALLILPLEPLAPSPPRPPAPRPDEGLLWLGLLLLPVTSLLAAFFDFWHYRLLTLDRGSLWPAILAGAALWLGRRRPRGTGPAFRRPIRDRFLAGLAAGFAHHVGADVAMVRLTLCVVAVWSLGLLLLVYLSLAAIVPAKRSSG